MRACLGVSPSGYYDWRNRPLSDHAKADAELLPEIRRVFRRSSQTYGYPRIHAALKQQGIDCSRHRVARLMRHNGIVAKMKARWNQRGQFRLIPSLASALTPRM